MKTIIYVICPPFYKTGGTELLHQLVFSLNNKGYSSSIAYLDSSLDKNINPAFLQYTKSYVSFDSIKFKKIVCL